ncbi:MAG: hypothetical protein DRJ18_00585 [Candidatus Methanomethylicota archaeon]|nr:MAG: hypothetical protein DRJ18_00585 [Candidatus Verstraetearchaeota archaeon]
MSFYEKAEQFKQQLLSALGVSEEALTAEAGLDTCQVNRHALANLINEHAQLKAQLENLGDKVKLCAWGIGKFFRGIRRDGFPIFGILDKVVMDIDHFEILVEHEERPYGQDLIIRELKMVVVRPKDLQYYEFVPMHEETALTEQTQAQQAI